MLEDFEYAFLAQNELVFKDVIANGTYGVVYFVYSTRFKTNFALKKIHKKFFRQAEVECMKQIDDCHIVSLYQYYQVNDYYYMLMEYCKTDLNRIIESNNSIDDETMKYYVRGIMESVKACHDRHVAHCDIKPSNFLMDSYGRIKIADFGLSAIYQLNPSIHNFKGTLLFMAPEILNRRQYNPMQADIWALGVTLFYMATKQLPFNAPEPQTLAMRTENGVCSLSLIKDKKLRCLVSRCIQVEPNARPTIDELLQDPYFFDEIEYNNFCAISKSLSVVSHDIILKPIVKPRNLRLIRSGSIRSSMRVLPISSQVAI